MKRRTDILTHLLLLLFILVACTADDAIKENLSHQDEYVTVRMHIPGMKAVATRAAETDNITSIVALVFRSNQLISVTEYSTTNSALHPISPISGTITIDKPNNGDVIHFLANLPADYSNEKKYIAYLNEQIGKSQTDVLCNLSSRDYDKLSYWGMATRNENNAVMDVILYRNKAMIEIKPGADCTFRQDELFIAGLDNPNNVGLLVPYNDKDGFNFDLDNNDYLTLPLYPEPLDKTDELTNYGTGYHNAYYVFEHANPNDANGLYVICKIGDDYYKVALHDEKGQPYPIIRNHKYTILVNDLDEGCKTYNEALSAEPIKPTVIETKDVTFTYTDNAMLNLNNNDTYTVTMNVPNGGILTALNIAAEGFTVTSSGGSLSGPTNNEYSYTGGTTQFTFTPTSAGNRTISFNGGAGVDITVPEKNISVTVNAAIAATANPSTIYYDGNDKNVTVNVTIPKGVSGLNISAPDFNYGDDTDGSYTYNRGDATTETTVQLEFTLKDNVKEVKTSTFTFSDASGNANVSSAEVDINVEQTPVQTNVLTVTPLTSTTIDLSGSGNNTVQLRLTIPDGVGQLEISTNNIFKIEGINGSDNPTFNGGNFNYYYYNIPNKTIEIGVTVNNDILAMVGKYMVTFNYSINNSSQSVSTSIDLVNNSLSTGVLWEGTQAINYSPGHSLSSEILNPYKGKTMKVDVSIGNDQYSTIQFKRSENTLSQYSTNDVLTRGEDTILEVVIPSDLDQAITIYGSGVTLKKIYFVE